MKTIPVDGDETWGTIDWLGIIDDRDIVRELKTNEIELFVPSALWSF
jgi:hypothetical protein